MLLRLLHGRFPPPGRKKWRKLRRAHYHSTTYIKCYGNIIQFISSYTFPQLPRQLRRLSKTQIFFSSSGFIDWFISLFFRVHVHVPDGRGSDASRSAPRLYLAEMPQPLINLSLGSSWDTGPATLCHSNLPSRHNTKTLHPSTPPPSPPASLAQTLFLPSSLLKPPPTPPHVWSLKAICELHSCESTLHAGCTNGRGRGCGGGVGGKGNQSTDTWRRGLKKMFFSLPPSYTLSCISYYSSARACIGRISIPPTHSCILILLH